MTRYDINKLPHLDESAHRTETCPSCGKSWKGDPIPNEFLRYYVEGSTHYSNLIGIEFPVYDGIAVWKCPHCKKLFRRFDKLP